MGFTVIDFLRWFRPFRRLERANVRLTLALERERARNEAWGAPYPAGHHFSAAPSRDEVAAAFARGDFGPPFAGVDLNESRQFQLLQSFGDDYARQPFLEKPAPGRRFHLDNGSYAHFDAVMLYCMMRHTRPRRIIEVGSGFSSAAMLDVNEQRMNGTVALTFIDPDMARLRALMLPGDQSRVTLIEKPVQEVPPEVFSTLGENDILFIDSSHVAKIGSDVNRIFFHILPGLAPGVLVHIHDITANFEYPRDWLEQGRAWNEQYLLRAFLMYNSAFRVELFPSWLASTRHEWLREHMPLCARGGGGQIWLRKVRH
jgi:predicted O-methyltransferase YrrM